MCAVQSDWPCWVRFEQGVSESMACLGDMDGIARDEPPSSQWSKDEPMKVVQIVSVDLGVL